MVNKKILTGLLAVIMVMSSVIPSFAAETTCTHPKDALDWVYPYKKEATCLEDGLTDEICTICGTIVKKDVPVPGDHFYEATSLTKPVVSDEGIEPGEIVYKCKWCGEEIKYTLNEDPASCDHASQAQYTDAYTATCESDGYTGDFICIHCGTIIKGETTKAYGHTWNNGTVTKEPTATDEGEKTFICTNCGKTRTEKIEKVQGGLSVPEKPVNTTAKEMTKFIVSGQTYKVTKAKEEVSFVAAKKNAKNIVIPATVTNKGVTYKVTSIAAKAVKANKKVKKVTIGANVKKIAANAIFNCPNLKKVTIKSTMLTKKTVSKKAFKGVSKKMVIKVPKKVKKVYVKIFKGCKVK